MSNLFLYENVYDDTKITYLKFKGKIYWNFGEIISNLYTPVFPKILKKTLLRHIQNIPQNEALIYHLIQYYYSNKDFRKSKILIRKILSKNEKDSQILFDIHSICLMMLVNILIQEEKLGEALDFAIVNLERLKNNQNNQMLTRSYFILGIIYSKLGDISTNFEEKIKYFELALACFKEANERDPENPNYIFYLARQYYDLKLFNVADDLLDNEKNKNKLILNNFNNHFVYALKILIHIALQQFDDALMLCDIIIKNNSNQIVKYNIIVVIKFYLLFVKLINPNSNVQKEEENFIIKIQNYIKLLFDALDDEIKNMEGIINKINSVRKESSQNLHTIFEFNSIQMELKEICKFSEFNPFIKENNLQDDDLKYSVKIYNHEKKNLENLRIELLKNFYFLTKMLNDRGYDKKNIIHNVLNDIIGRTSSSNPIDDVNLLFIKAAQLHIEKKDSEAQNLYKKILEMNPSHMMALKKLSKLLLNKNDLTNAFIFINKAIKLNEEESELWNLLSVYYMRNGDDPKYYECVLKELEISKFHSNCFLDGLIPKIII